MPVENETIRQVAISSFNKGGGALKIAPLFKLESGSRQCSALVHLLSALCTVHCALHCTLCACKSCTDPNHCILSNTASMPSTLKADYEDKPGAALKREKNKN